MEALKEIRDAFEKFTKGIIACTDAEGCLIWVGIEQRNDRGKGDTYREENINGAENSSRWLKWHL